LIAGNPHQVLVQAIAVASAAAYSFFGTFALLKAVGFVTALRASAQEEAQGMDPTQHGEEAYTSGEGAILVLPDGSAEQVSTATAAEARA